MNPFEILQDQINLLGATITSGEVTVSDPVTRRCTILSDGVSLPDIPCSGGTMLVGDQVWIVRNGSTVIAFGARAIAVTFGAGAPAGAASLGSVYFDTNTWTVYSYT